VKSTGICSSYYNLRFGPAALKRGCAGKANFDPNQPRVPAGNLAGGQWTSEGGAVLDDRPTDVSAARRISPALEAECLFQYRQDIFICNTVRLRACFAQAALRYANCLRGLSIPPLNF
jgi:hypothetical protein